ncbi:hypothetical protein Cch01nite_35470 [Cellulomonas chitinilytica]|uniref:Uncharacterized protein n=1 Tax=Cellulomonas chitinilytica TaxID=398759 RepID=A0A919U180_9CELL|nr:hypothetical protein [Cellulomonas chitinilytica]GIG22823.1 hypothetical protein Cch01nite_35470 [Cellulomonas chitinilytica]
MGRHATPAPDAARPPRERLLSRVVTWLERLALGAAAGGVTFGVLHWAGVDAAATRWCAGIAAVVVVVATWLASTVPGQHDASA